MAAPIHDCNGAMVGAVDLSTSVEDARPEHMRAVVELAAEIEANLQPAG